jgi:hypothetical protein
MKDRRVPAFGITIYRDEVDEANVDNRFMGTRPTAKLAIAEAQKIGPTIGWDLWSASVDEGELVSRLIADDRVWLTDFESDPQGRKWYIGPDWVEVG